MLRTSVPPESLPVKAHFTAIARVRGDRISGGTPVAICLEDREKVLQAISDVWVTQSRNRTSYLPSRHQTTSSQKNIKSELSLLSPTGRSGSWRPYRESSSTGRYLSVESRRDRLLPEQWSLRRRSVQRHLDFGRRPSDNESKLRRPDWILLL